MRFERMRRSDNVQDRRGQGRGPRLALGGGAGGLILLLIYVLLGGNPLQLLGPGGPASSIGGGSAYQPASPQEAQLADQVARVLGDTEDVWKSIFASLNHQYREPELVLFNGQVDSACGYNSAAVGPFYCPADATIYIDLSFYDDLAREFNAPGDFAQAYVIAHEVGHHVQRLLGISRDDLARSNLTQEQRNDYSVRVELQADFLAGIWAHHAQKARQVLEPGDLEEGLRAAAAIGDDRIQLRSRGYVVPESFTHGSADQRVRWFRKGLETGDIRLSDTFASPSP